MPGGEGVAADDSVATLCARLADDLDDGFSDLVRSEQRVVYSVALSVTRSPADAEDLTAETFLRAYRALRGYDRARRLSLRPRSWLLTIALNTWRNSVRDSGRRPHLIPVGDVPDRHADGMDVEREVERAEGRRELRALLAQLPLAQSLAVVLRHVVGLPLADVAKVLKCPEGTAKSHVSRGVSRLRTLYTAVPVSAEFAAREEGSHDDARR